MPFINIITELFAKLKDGTGNEITSTDLGGGKRGLDVNVEITPSEAVMIKGEDGFLGQIGPDGRLHITSAPPISTTGTTKVNGKVYTFVEGHNYSLSDPYVIPNLKTVTIVKMYGTGDVGSHSCGIYLSDSGVWDDDVVLITGFHFSGGIIDIDIDYKFVGDGVKSIITKITRRDKGKLLLGAEWIGFLED